MISFRFKTLPEDLRAIIMANVIPRQVLQQTLKNAARPRKKQRKLSPNLVRALKQANVIFGWDQKTDVVNIFYMSTHAAKNEAVFPLCFQYHQDTEELDALCTLVAAVKGRCEYQGTKAPESYPIVFGKQRTGDFLSRFQKPKE